MSISCCHQLQGEDLPLSLCELRKSNFSPTIQSVLLSKHEYKYELHLPDRIYYIEKKFCK